MIVSSAIGCAAPARPAPPPGWPMTWSDRRLFFTHDILVYARDGSEADACATQLIDVEQQFQQRTGGQSSHGLLVVNGVEDTGIGNLKLEDLLANASDDVDSGAKRKRELAKAGVAFSEFALSLTTPVDRQQLSTEPGFTSAGLSQVDWTAAVPSNARSAQFGDHLIDGGLKAQNLNFFQRMLILPFMPLIHGILNDALGAERDTVLYECLCKAQPTWSQERRKDEIHAYQELRMGKVMKSLKAATQQVDKAKQ